MTLGTTGVPASDVLHSTDTHIVFRVPTGPPSSITLGNSATASQYASVAPGPVKVTTPAGEATTADSFTVTHLELTGTLVTQGIAPSPSGPGYPLIRGKDTLVQYFVRTREEVPGELLAIVGSAECAVYTPDKTLVASLHGNVGGGGILSAVGPGVRNTTLSTSVNCLVPGYLLTESDAYLFKVRLFSPGLEVGDQLVDGVEIASAEYSEAAEFVETIVPRVLVVPIVPFEGSSLSPEFDADRFWTELQKSTDALKRIIPASDVDVVVSANYYAFPALVDEDGLIDLEGVGVSRTFVFEVLPSMQHLNRLLAEYNCLESSVVDNVLTCPTRNPAPAMFVTGLIDVDLQKGDAFGVAVPPRSTISRVARFVLENSLPVAGPAADFLNDVTGSITCGATFGRYCPDPLEEMVESFVAGLPLEIGGAESLIFLQVDDTAHTWAMELAHNLGLVDPFERNHDTSNITHSLYDESSGERVFPDLQSGPVVNVPRLLEFTDAPENLPKSVMAFVPGHNNENTLFEAADYNRILAEFREATPGSLGLLRSPDLSQSSGERGFSIQGVINIVEGELIVVESKLVAGRPTTDVLANSPITIALIDSSENELLEQGIPFTLGLLPDGRRPLGPPDLTTVIFSATVPVPEGAASVEVRLRDRPLQRLRLSANPPTLEVISPSEGDSFAGNDGS